MHIKYLRLYQFRNFEDMVFEPNPEVNIVIGRNGIGKTNLLEAIGYLGCLRSHRISGDKFLLMIGKGEFLIKGVANTSLGDISVRVDYFADRGRRVGWLDEKKVERLVDIVGRIPSVLFSPLDMNFIRGAPSDRRRMMDIFISQIDRSYLEDFSRYTHILSQRNALLKGIGRGEADSSLLDMWDEGLVKYGEKVMRSRMEWIGGIAGATRRSFVEVTDGELELLIEYEPSVKFGDDIKNDFKELLISKREEDIRYGQTNYGPHRDDILFKLNGVLASLSASQGQTRLIAIAFRLAQCKLMEDYIKEPPILLLDDMGSELDIVYLSETFRLIPKGGQVFITTTREDLVPIVSGNKVLWGIEGGKVVRFREN
ncbi:MAG: DNA replication/repair protein RecF [bacterium]